MRFFTKNRLCPSLLDPSSDTLEYKVDSRGYRDINVISRSKIDAFSTYTKTDGSWEILEFHYSKSKPQGNFNNNTGIIRVNFFIDEGAANGYTYGIDEVELNK